MSKARDAFGGLKAAMRRRLELIAAPLEAIYTEQRLGERLGSLGKATQGAKLALDDAGLLPMPKAIYGTKPSAKSYETFLLRLIVMASIALDGATHALRASPPLFPLYPTLPPLCYLLPWFSVYRPYHVVPFAVALLSNYRNASN